VQPAVRIKGYREVQRALLRAEKGLRAALRAGLKEAVEPVAKTAQMLETRWAGASIGTIGPRITLAGAAVTQRARKVTGKRPDFGALQMTEAMIPALEAHDDEIEDRAGEALDALFLASGFH
jgi:hypothetical protein